MGRKAISFLRSLRGRYLIVLLALTALPTLLIGALAYQNARQTIEARVKAQLTSIADLKKEQIILSTERANVGQNFNWHPAIWKLPLK